MTKEWRRFYNHIHTPNKIKTKSHIVSFFHLFKLSSRQCSAASLNNSFTYLLITTSHTMYTVRLESHTGTEHCFSALNGTFER